jgi:hypothetical protein
MLERLDDPQNGAVVQHAGHSLPIVAIEQDRHIRLDRRRIL